MKEIQAPSDLWLLKFTSAANLAEQLLARLLEHFAALLRTRSQASAIRLAHLVEKMNHLYRSGSLVLSMLACEEILRQDPDNAKAILTRGVCRIRLHGMNDGDAIASGISDCKKVLSNEPSNYRARYNLANFKLLSPDHEPEEIRKELGDLFSDFPEYEFYFKNDLEFNRMLLLRETWSKRSR